MLIIFTEFIRVLIFDCYHNTTDTFYQVGEPISIYIKLAKGSTRIHEKMIMMDERKTPIGNIRGSIPLMSS